MSGSYTESRLVRIPRCVTICGMKSLEKTCTKCGSKGPFYFNKSMGCYRSRCIKCHNESNRNWAKQNPERVRRISRKWERTNKRYWHITTKYGLTKTDYYAMLERQGCKCCICQRTLIPADRHTVVDHCHRTNRVRGILCRNCNTGIGQLQDDPVLLLRAVEYLTA